MWIVVPLIMALIFWIGAAMAFAAISAWLTMLMLGALGHHVAYFPCLAVWTLCLLFVVKVRVR